MWRYRITRRHIQQQVAAASTLLDFKGCLGSAPVVTAFHPLSAKTRRSSEDALVQSLLGDDDDFSFLETGKVGQLEKAASEVPVEHVKDDIESKEEEATVPIDAQKPALSTLFTREEIKTAAAFVEVRRNSASIEWKCCMCSTFTGINERVCGKCQANCSKSFRSAFPPSRLVALFPPIWVCEQCETENRSDGAVDSRAKLLCTKCRSPFPGVREWYCPSCHQLNSLGSKQCTSCFLNRPVSWSCDACGKDKLSVFVHTCSSCATKRRTEDGSSIVKCPFCHAINDFRAELCERCVAPLHASTHSKFKSKLVEKKEAVHPLATTSTNMQPHLTQADRSNESSGSWWCAHCNIELRRNCTFCDVCLRPRSNSVSHTLPPSQPASRGEWQCPHCRKLCGNDTRECCGQARKIPVGYWFCATCLSTNKNGRPACIGCGGPPPSESWECSLCSKPNDASTFVCSTCSSPHPLLWCCSACQVCHHVSVSACECGGRKPSPPIPLLCRICEAPNAPDRRACFRCRCRLSSDAWNCSLCGFEKNSRTALRCKQCLSPRHFHMGEVTWVCDVCNTPVASGGDLPERKKCPKCGYLYTSHCVTFPTRWICKQCKLCNRSTASSCVECGQKRLLPPFKSPVVCMNCFQETTLSETEECVHCHASLSPFLDASGAFVRDMEEKMEEGEIEV